MSPDRRLKLRKVVIHPSLQSKEVESRNLNTHLSGVRALNSKLHCLTAAPPTPDTHIAPRLDPFKGTFLIQ